METLPQHQTLHNKLHRFYKKSSARIAGLFFYFFLWITLSAISPVAAPKFSADHQIYFRRFLEVFTPLVLKHEKQVGNPRWGSKNKDCAGLVRYLFWEAMQRHDERFYRLYPSMHSVTLSSPTHSFAEFSKAWTERNATSSDLLRHAFYLGKERKNLQLKTGDFLYYESARLNIRHVMLVIRVEQTPYLIYHTGGVPSELRIRTFADLDALPQSQWHARATNHVFRGFYRATFLD
ncbi:MAG TPA: DUF1175 family protein [Turneriella sp.]|nr:DUF1175 family protein [Turneriella sp.]